MKLFISVDMEGITGVERTEELFRGMPGFDLFRQVMAGDANAVIDGAIAGGATEIVVSDSHGYMCNIHPDDIMPGVMLKRGQLRRQWCQMKGFDASFDAVMQIGFHAKAGSDAILAHTWIPGFRDVRVNGESLPEPSLNGYLAGAFGVPVVMLSADDRGVAESRSVLGDIRYVETKTSLGGGRAKQLPIDQSRRLLREGARRAMSDASKIAPLRCALPVTIELDLSPDAPKRSNENFNFIDLTSPPNAPPLGDVDLVLATVADVSSPRRGTIAFTRGDYAAAYRTLGEIMALIYERDIENLHDRVAASGDYARPGLEDILGRDYPLNEIGARRR